MKYTLDTIVLDGEGNLKEARGSTDQFEQALKITRQDDFDGAVLNFAVRYALGRYSYAPSLVIGQIKPILQDCSDKTLWCFEKDIAEFLKDCENTGSKSYFFGDPYVLEWKKFLDDVVKEIERRKTEE